MPEIYPVLGQGLQGILDDLGIQITPRAPLFWMSDIIQPVALVNSQVPINASLVSAPQTITSEGQQSNPAANLLLADSGQLASGPHSFTFWASFLTSATNGEIAIQHRDAANAATLFQYNFQFLAGASVNGGIQLGPLTLTLATNERVRCININNIASGGAAQVAILHRLEA